MAGLLVIDDFTKPDPSAVIIVPMGVDPTQVVSEPSVGALGGQRDVMFKVYGQSMPNSAVSVIGFDNNYSVDAFQLGTAGLAPTVLTLQYSGSDQQNTPAALVNAHALAGGAGIDLTDGGSNDRFELSFISSDAQPTTGLDVTITITSPEGGLSTLSGTIKNQIGLPFEVFFPFTSLAGNAQLTSVDSVSFVFNGGKMTNNIDFELQMLATSSSQPVPEPAGATLMALAAGGLGLAGLAARRRRKPPPLT